MAGIFFELFVFLTLIAVGISIFSFAKRSIGPLLMSALFFALSGGLLLSFGLRFECGSTYATGVTTYSYCTLWPFEEPALLAIGLIFVGIGLIIAIYSTRLILRRGEE